VDPCALHAQSLKAECRLATDTSLFSPATALAIAPTGVRLLSSHRFGGGTVLTVRLFPLAGETIVIKRARVVNLRPEGDELWLHSCSFTKPLTDEEMQALLETERGADS
jgi:hypothetical protein